MAEDQRPSEATLAVFAAIRRLRGLEPFPAWPYKQALSKAELIQNRSLAWNAFISIVGVASYEELSPVQQVAHLGYWYEAEVSNGGHLQYFRNQSGLYVAETIAALPLLGAEAHAAVLKDAFKRIGERPELIDRNKNHGELARTYPFKDIDRAFWQCKPELDELLHRYLDEHLGDFIVFKEDA
jgi:Domain of unknown function (DUF4375)